MLSRVAERMYWFGRYLERAENTARLIRVYTNVLMDVPGKVKHIWEDLIKITSSEDGFYSKYKLGNERNVIKFMLTDKSNPSSLILSVSAARENARTTREIMPAEAWEKINEFYLFVRQNSDNALAQNKRHEFLDDVINHCQQMTGLIFGNMSHGNAYNFIRMGRNLERADMVTRILDVGCINLLQEQASIPDAYDNLLWMNVLRSLGAYQMYRQNVKDKINGEDVVDFLIKDTQFPRSVRFCLGEVENCFSKLQGLTEPLREVTRSQRMVDKTDSAALMQSGLHEFIDQLQIDFAQIHTALEKTWFDHGQSQSQKSP